MKKLFIIGLLVLIIPFINVNADNSGDIIDVSSHGIIGDGVTDNTAKIQNLIDIASKENKDLYFPQGKYLISDTLYLKTGVSLIGDINLSIIKGNNEEYAIVVKDGANQNLTGVEIKHFVFDNVLFHSNSSSHDKMIISENIFINGKKGDLNLLPIKPDSYNKNGGELTAYYIMRNNQNIEISHNVFLRDEFSKGRGISTYRTSDTLIESNYFGVLEDIDKLNSIMSDKVKFNLTRLSEYSKSGSVIVNPDQGHFMTAINNLNFDNNTTIRNNIINLNTDIEEVHYEDGTGDSLGYNRDHLIYSKGFNDLKIYGNYFSGQPNNADGGIKVRNGEKVSIVSNYFDNVPLLIYIQSDNNTDGIFSDIWIENNLFYIQNNHNLWGTAISALFYEVDRLENMTIKNNRFLSDEKEIDRIKIDLNNKTSRIENLHFENNRYLITNNHILHEVIRSTTGENIATKGDVLSKTPYYHDFASEIRLTKIPLIDKINDVPFSFNKGKLISDADVIIVDDNNYYNGVISEGKHTIILSDKVIVPQKIEGNITEQFITKSSYLTLDFGIKISDQYAYVGEAYNIKYEIVGGNSEDVIITSSDENIAKIINGRLQLLQPGNVTITLNTDYGYQASCNLDVKIAPIFEFNINNQIYLLTEKVEIPFTKSDNIETVIFTSLDEDIFTVDNNIINPVKTGYGRLKVSLFVDGREYYEIYDIRVKPQPITITHQNIDAYYYLGEIIKFNPRSNDENVPMENIIINYSDNLLKISDIEYKVIAPGKIFFEAYNSLDQEDHIYLEATAYDVLKEINLPSNKIQIQLGDSTEITVNFNPINSFDIIELYNTNNDVIKIQDNLITPLKTGNAVLTVKGVKSGVITTVFVEVIPDTVFQPIEQVDSNLTKLYYVIPLSIGLIGLFTLYYFKKHK